MTVLCTNEDHDEDVPAIFDVSFPGDYWKPCKACRDCLEIIVENLLESPTTCLIAPVATPEYTDLPDNVVREWRCPKCHDPLLVVPAEAAIHERLCDGPENADQMNIQGSEQVTDL